MSMKPAILAAAILAAASPCVRAQVLDGTSNTMMLSVAGAPAAELLKAPGLPWMRYDVVPRLQNPQPLIGVSHSAAGLAVHSGSGGSEDQLGLVLVVAPTRREMLATVAGPCIA